MASIDSELIARINKRKRRTMDLETVSTKHLNELEQQAHELVSVLRKANLQNAPIFQQLQQFEQEVGQTRRARFDAANPEYSGY